MIILFLVETNDLSEKMDTKYPIGVSVCGKYTQKTIYKWNILHINRGEYSILLKNKIDIRSLVPRQIIGHAPASVCAAIENSVVSVIH
jgi:hypothetical protein